MRLPPSFFARGAETVARELIGCRLVIDGDQHRIVETEAYVGRHDLACHAAKGRTARTEVLFGPPGRAYVYLVYGMHHLLNVVCAAEGDPQAVLIRSLASDGERRLDGPGRLTKALGITVATDNRMDLEAGRFWIEAGTPCETIVTPRIGVDYAGAWAAAPLRFVAADASSLIKR